ncbi:sulfite exporter TauE/SafE family protein [Ramlibacter rhizophilus]|uniref:Sulfite exporter TauE/SafE family protein n=1 Tax=Ramlibacter rhizophilus TaxID=1781167 RepID=A0A4Z0BF82_9BURK|nr:sulfite exporter TauE/SafE family protein [Ramlibacter rhizophilus]TFY96784.1 sulfite exporter TauE/SafE family protein [Ramlibacter rhizophilus]
MSTSLALTALLMGLAGGPHCAAMCGAACAGVTGAGGRLASSRLWTFQAGRLAGYALAGGVAAGTVQAFAWASTQSAALRPAWTVFHLGVLAWGLTLLVLARQPAWAQQAGLAAWGRVRPLVQRTGGVFAAGALWTFMPCGLLWSALLVASLTGSPVQGALAMALFALGSALGLVAGPVLLARVRTLGNRVRQDWGTRLAGGLLAATAVFALWMDLAEKIALWCA